MIGYHASLRENKDLSGELWPLAKAAILLILILASANQPWNYVR